MPGIIKYGMGTSLKGLLVLGIALRHSASAPVLSQSFKAGSNANHITVAILFSFYSPENW